MTVEMPARFIECITAGGRTVADVFVCEDVEQVMSDNHRFFL